MERRASTGLFKTLVPQDELFAFLEQFCTVQRSLYVVDINAFRRLVFRSEWYEHFVASIKPHYHVSQQFNCERPLNQRNLITLLRQICASHQISFRQKVSYSKDDYNHDYYIRRPPPPVLQKTCDGKV